jgi:RES domain-containing protein
MWAWTPLSGDGAKQHGGRFNRPGQSALYTSLDATTAWMEAQQGFPFKPQPMTLVAYQVDCIDLVDLQDTTSLTCLKSSLAQINCPWENMAAQGQEPPTWILAETLLKMGYAGIVTPSFAPGCTQKNRNLVLWDWTETAPHRIQVIDDLGRLPQSIESWKTTK